MKSDGCNMICKIEADWTCSGVGAGKCSEICGDGLIVGSENCDDGSNDNIGCKSGCKSAN